MPHPMIMQTKITQYIRFIETKAPVKHVPIESVKTTSKMRVLKYYVENKAQLEMWK